MTRHHQSCEDAPAVFKAMVDMDLRGECTLEVKPGSLRVEKGGPPRILLLLPLVAIILGIVFIFSVDLDPYLGQYGVGFWSEFILRGLATVTGLAFCYFLWGRWAYSLSVEGDLYELHRQADRVLQVTKTRETRSLHCDWGMIDELFLTFDSTQEVDRLLRIYRGEGDSVSAGGSEPRPHGRR